MNKSYILTALCSLLLAGCGGGGGGDGGSGGSSANYSALYGGTDYTSIATTTATASTSFNYATPSLQFVAFGPTCTSSTSQSITRTANVDVYGDGTITDPAVFAKVAKMTEASVGRLKTIFQITSSVGLDNTNRVKVCASGSNTGNGSAGFATLQIGVPSSDWQLAQLIQHELVHMVQAQSLRCNTHQYRFERWLAEGLALRIGMQDETYKSEVASLKTSFEGAGFATPFHELPTWDFPTFARYPGYRLAVDTFLGVSGKSEKDVNEFLKSYGASVGCPAWNNPNDPYSGIGTGWKTQFDAYFGADLRGTGVLGTTFWTTAPTYAK